MLLWVAIGCSAGCYRASPPDAVPYDLGPLIAEGVASFYGRELDGRRTASGETYDRLKMTAAHPALRFGTCLTVVNVQNRRRVKVRVNDRGPFVQHRIIDLSEAAARELGMISAGVARVRLYGCDR